MSERGYISSSEPDVEFVSLIIISKNNYELLKQAIQSIVNCEYSQDKIQLIILEETGTPHIFPSRISYHTIPVENRGFGYARNRALSYAEHEIIVFTDDDCIVEKDWLRKLIQPLQESKETAAVSGAVHVPPCGVVGKCENILGFPGGGMKYVRQSEGKLQSRETFSTCNCAIRKEYIDSVGGFDETMKYGGEDENLSRKIGEKGRIVFQPDAVVYHKPRDSLKSVFFWFARRGYADVYRVLIMKNRNRQVCHFLKNSVLMRFTVFFLISFTTGLRLTLLVPVVVLYYGYLTLKYSWSYAYFPSVKIVMMVPVVRTVMDAGRDWGILKGLLNYKKILS